MINTRKSVLSTVKIGDIFNQQEITAILIAPFSGKPTFKHFSVIVKCLSCGNERKRLRSHLINISCNIRGCGIKRSTKINIGDIFGKLTVTSIDYDEKLLKYNYTCRCECGNSALYRRLTRRQSVECNNCVIKTIGLKNTLPNNGAALNVVISKYKKRAKAKNIKFSLTPEMFVALISQPCHYCKSPPIKDYKGFVRNGIDRIDSKYGYTIDNSQPCCLICNRAKSDLTNDEFIAWINKLTLNNL